MKSLNLDHVKEFGASCGGGNWGDVYAYDLPDERTGLPAGTKVAVKIFKKEVLKRPEGIRRMESEYASGRRIRHRNVVRFYELGESQGVPYLIMEYVVGGSLQKLIEARRAPIGESELTFMARQLIAGVRAIHEAGIVHRDLKPENILVDRLEGGNGGPVLKIGDFGVAADLTDASLTATGEVLGSLRYAAPEYLVHEHRGDYDERVDVYSLGGILYFCSTGAHPLAKLNSPGAIIQLVRESHLMPTPTASNPGLSVAWNSLIYGLLGKQPETRANLDEADAVLDSISSGSKIYVEKWKGSSALGDYLFPVVVDLMNLREGAVQVGRHIDTRFDLRRVGGEMKRTIYEHPYFGDVPGQPGKELLPETVLRFPLLALPRGCSLAFHSFTGIADGGSFERTPEEPVDFIVKMNGEVVSRRSCWGRKWEKLVVPIDQRMIPLQLDLCTQAVGRSTSAWSAWGEPRIVAADG